MLSESTMPSFYYLQQSEENNLETMGRPHRDLSRVSATLKVQLPPLVPSDKSFGDVITRIIALVRSSEE